MIKCSECPRCKDVYPEDVTDHHGNHFCICGLSGNMVFTYPRKEKRYNGQGWIHLPEGSCGLYNTFNDAWKAMTKPEQDRWKAKHEPQVTIFDILEEANNEQQTSL